MFPSIPTNKFQQVGNAAGAGAVMSLVSREKRARAREIASSVRYLELAKTPGFNAAFVESTYLGRYKIESGKRVEI